MKRYWIECAGTVQGVGFRWFISQTARRLGLTGHVENCDNGQVQMEVQGEPETLERFLARVRVGNGYSEIQHMEIREISPDLSEHEFEIKI